jgi:hypothetical protein
MRGSKGSRDADELIIPSPRKFGEVLAPDQSRANDPYGDVLHLAASIQIPGWECSRI